ncbi:hypothetical protein [Sorangium sp. So ce117]|uniref:hypothetical protein n=1 Tax=Sorangium sp. So ce117 TaxID=3133277 RepID=UPI003F63A79E
MERTGRTRLRELTSGAKALATGVIAFAALAMIWFVVNAARKEHEPPSRRHFRRR